MGPLVLFCFALKLGIFPFIFWFVYVTLTLPNFFFLMSAVIHKVPSFLIISLFGGVLEEFYGFLRLMFLLQTRNLIGGLIIATSIDYRIAIISSSVGNNSWFFLRVWARPFLFYAYFFFYLLGVFILLIIIGVFNNLRVFNSGFRTVTLTIRALLLSIRGLPPFPVFFFKGESFIWAFNKTWPSFGGF